MRKILLAAVCGAAVFGQQYPFVNVAGDPRSASMMLLDHRGGLWLDGSGVLRYFDGGHFFSLEQFGQDIGGYLTEDSEGGIWIAGGSRGLYRFHQGSMQKVFSGYARDIVTVRPGLVVVFTGPAGPARPSHPDIYRFAEDRGKWTGVKLADWKARSGDYPKVDKNGTVTYACDHAWCELPAQTIADWHPGYQGGPIRHPDPYPGLESVLRDRFGCVWFRSASLTTSYQCPGNAKPIEIPFEIAGSDLDISEDSSGTIWLPSGSRLAIGRPGHFQVIRGANGMPDANHTVVSPDGTVWLTGSNGFFRWQYPFRAEYWTAREGLDLPFSLLEDDEKMLTISGAGISFLSKERDRWLPLGESNRLGGARKLNAGPEHTLYATLDGGGVGISGRPSVAQLTADGSIMARTHALLDSNFYGYLVPKTPDGPVWFSENAVARVVRIGKELRFHVGPLTEAPKQRLAACTTRGIVTLEDARIHHISKADGLLEQNCRTLSILPNGDLWVGYLSGGSFALIRRSEGNVASIRQYESGGDIGEAVTENIDFDSRGWIWRGAAGGSLYIADATSAEAGTWVELNGSDGIHSSLIPEAFLRGRDGSVWWGTQDSSIYHFTPPADFVRPTRPPHFFLSGYSWNGGAPQFADAVHSVPYGASLTAFVGSLQFDRRNAMRFRYRVTPGQPAWRDTRNFDIALGKLPWGRHKLELQAKLVNGPWSAIQSEVFEIAKPFWVTWPFLLGLAGVTLSGGALSYRWRKKQRERASKAFPNLKEWRLAAFSPEVQGLLGQVLDGRYRLQRVIARGGFATVLNGEDLQYGNRPCAVKVFRRELSDKDWLRRHFEREVSALEQLRHVNVAEIYSHGLTPEGSPYLAMEFIEGQTLREVLNAGPLSAPYAASLLRQVGAALEVIHACGICHRDVKPENLMIRAAGPVEASLVVIDFSIAIVRRPDETIHGLSRAAGTIYYMAPEQAIGYADVTTDIYSLAKVLLEMLTGARLSDLLPDASMDLPNRVRELLAALAVRLGTPSIELIASALEFDPARRPRNVREFADVIAGDLAQD